MHLDQDHWRIEMPTHEFGIHVKNLKSACRLFRLLRDLDENNAAAMVNKHEPTLQAIDRNNRAIRQPTLYDIIDVQEFNDGSLMVALCFDEGAIEFISDKNLPEELGFNSIN
tara:strand:+ start:82 stop:417 length:336 start_codon:yes stop_codon:yes gene_type:complete